MNPSPGAAQSLREWEVEAGICDWPLVVCKAGAEDDVLARSTSSSVRHGISDHPRPILSRVAFPGIFS